MSELEKVLNFWFGELNEKGRADELHVRRWFAKDPNFDEEIRREFGELYEAVVCGERDDWLESERGLLAIVVVIDQFSRNLFRDSAAMYAHDARALEVALMGIQRGDDRTLQHAERSFLYMPLMHSEDPATQRRCVALFTAWRDELKGDARESVAFSLRFAIDHMEIVERFGRFPHRNEILGRESTAEELEFLKQPGSSF